MNGLDTVSDLIRLNAIQNGEPVPVRRAKKVTKPAPITDPLELAIAAKLSELKEAAARKLAEDQAVIDRQWAQLHAEYRRHFKELIERPTSRLLEGKLFFVVAGRAFSIVLAEQIWTITELNSDGSAKWKSPFGNEAGTPYDKALFAIAKKSL